MRGRSTEIKKQLGDGEDGDLPEKLGHRPIEVISGAFLGIFLAWLVCMIMVLGCRLSDHKNLQRRGFPRFFCARKNGPRRKRRQETGMDDSSFSRAMIRATKRRRQKEERARRSRKKEGFL